MNMYQFFKPRVYNVNETEYDSSDWQKAMPKTYEWGEKILWVCFIAPKLPPTTSSIHHTSLALRSPRHSA